MYHLVFEFVLGFYSQNVKPERDLVVAEYFDVLTNDCLVLWCDVIIILTLTSPRASS
jgi:hypothetical protein